MKVVAIIQARMCSTRLPGKVLMDIEGKPMIQRVLERVQRSELVDLTVAAIPYDAELYRVVKANHHLCFHSFPGTDDDVLGRYDHVARKQGADWIVRVTGDMPLVDPAVIDQLLEECWVGGYQFGEVIQGAFVEGRYVKGHGFRCQVFTAEVLRIAQLRAKASDREHVISYMRRMWLPRERVTVSAGGNYSVDTQEDLDRVRDIYKHFGRDDMTWQEITAYAGGRGL